MAAHERHPHDEEELQRRQASGEGADPNRPSRSDDAERQHPGGNPGDPQASPAPTDEKARADSEERRTEGTLEDGSRLPD